MGTKLFERGNREITLTKDGEYFLHQARQILTLTNKTISNLHQGHDIAGSLFIGSAETQNMRTVGRALNQLHENYPHILTHLLSDNADEVRRNIDSGVIDFGVVLDTTNKRDYNFLSLPGQATWGLIMPKSARLASQKSVKPSDLKNVDLLVSRQTGVDVDMENWLGSSFDELNIVATYNLLNNAIILVQSGLGYALCIDGVVNLKGSNLTFVPLEPKLAVGVSLIWSKQAPLSDPAAEFLKEIQKTVYFPE